MSAVTSTRIMSLLNLTIYKYFTYPLFFCIAIGIIFNIFGMKDAVGAVYLLYIAYAALLTLVIGMGAQLSSVEPLKRLGGKGAPLNKLKKYIGKDPIYIDAAISVYGKTPSENRMSGTGIAYDGEFIYVMEAGEVAKFKWENVRSWRYEIVGQPQSEVVNNTFIASGSPTVVASAVASAAAMQAAVNRVNNINSAAIAHRASGFFVTVDSIEHPVWQFTCTDKKILNKWFEIFTQLNEGRLQA